ncbi:hypothetical protein EVAR_22950_1 [Eumeta japonica]|uniref:Uncharacterized protein n=1 Tax=Eumeta variegata TaxID=151549 RepID=A0A4C1UPX3_EUMVA|nr:hypothetical protein EVAR_22950_1 [Eumeta japonica]
MSGYLVREPMPLDCRCCHLVGGRRRPSSRIRGCRWRKGANEGALFCTLSLSRAELRELDSKELKQNSDDETAKTQKEVLSRPFAGPGLSKHGEGRGD